MHLHILGIAGTFMGGFAQIAKAAGHQVSGSDQHVYPPMSTQLEHAGIGIIEGFDAQQLDSSPDQVVVGNVMSRGMPVVERMLNERMRYNSAPQWLYENVLSQRRVLAVSGTHGKTTTASMLAWILEKAGLEPGFLIGGVPENFGVSARLGESPWFVIEADEYDTAFFDKRSKFVHYHPEVLVINNLEFDHADIFPDLAAIQRQFHHVIRMVPEQGSVIAPQEDAVEEVLSMGLWSKRDVLAVDGQQQGWGLQKLVPDYSSFQVLKDRQLLGEVHWAQIGRHNALNALAAIAAAGCADIPAGQAIQALEKFSGVQRRLQLRGSVNDIRVYDDFAHHPTAIETTLSGLRANVGNERILAVFEPRSNTMRMGVHGAKLGAAFDLADQLLIYSPPDLDWSLTKMNVKPPMKVFDSIDRLLDRLVEQSRPGDHILIMSNGGFGGLHQRFLQALHSQ